MTRTITVWESAKQKKTVIGNSSATTLGELKAEMAAAGVDLTNMDILEGVSHTKLLSNESALPHDIPYKGQLTNDLMIYLTLQNKKVASGAMSRKEIGQWIKDNNLGAEVQAQFGDNWTRVSTPNLEAFYAQHCGASAPAEAEEQEVPETLVEESTEPKASVAAKVDAVIEALDMLTEALYEDDYIYSDTYSKVHDVLNSVKPKKAETKPEEVQGGFSLDEINSMIDEM